MLLLFAVAVGLAGCGFVLENGHLSCPSCQGLYTVEEGVWHHLLMPTEIEDNFNSGSIVIRNKTCHQMVNFETSLQLAGHASYLHLSCLIGTILVLGIAARYHHVIYRTSINGVPVTSVTRGITNPMVIYSQERDLGRGRRSTISYSRMYTIKTLALAIFLAQYPLHSGGMRVMVPINSSFSLGPDNLHIGSAIKEHPLTPLYRTGEFHETMDSMSICSTSLCQGKLRCDEKRMGGEQSYRRMWYGGILDTRFCEYGRAGFCMFREGCWVWGVVMSFSEKDLFEVSQLSRNDGKDDIDYTGPCSITLVGLSDIESRSVLSRNGEHWLCPEASEFLTPQAGRIGSIQITSGWRIIASPETVRCSLGLSGPVCKTQNLDTESCIKLPAIFEGHEVNIRDGALVAAPLDTVEISYNCKLNHSLDLCGGFDWELSGIEDLDEELTVSVRSKKAYNRTTLQPVPCTDEMAYIRCDGEAQHFRVPWRVSCIEDKRITSVRVKFSKDSGKTLLRVPESVSTWHFKWPSMALSLSSPLLVVLVILALILRR